MTPEQLDAAMKTIDTANGTLGTKLMGSDLPGAARDAQTLASTFAGVERFWAQANKPDAVMLAQRARAAASDVAAAATAGDGSRAMKARGTMTATCMPCHGVYREGDAQTGYRIKAGAI
jgi:cytochrome c553